MLQRPESKENPRFGGLKSGVQELYRRAGDLYYPAEHIETFFRRANASDIKPLHILNHILQFYCAFLQKNVASAAGRLFSAQLRRERRTPTATPR